MTFPSFPLLLPPRTICTSSSLRIGTARTPYLVLNSALRGALMSWVQFQSFYWEKECSTGVSHWKNIGKIRIHYFFDNLTAKMIALNLTSICLWCQPPTLFPCSDELSYLPSHTTRRGEMRFATLPPRARYITTELHLSLPTTTNNKIKNPCPTTTD